MKILNYLLIIPAMLVFQNLTAQIKHLKLSEQFPSRGQRISFTYDPAGTNLEHKEKLTAKIYYLTSNGYPNDNIVLKSDGKIFTGGFTLPNTTNAFFIKINKGDIVDNNTNKGYVYMVYNKKTPIQGAYAALATFYNGPGNAYAKVPANKVQVVKSFKQEIATYPGSEQEYAGMYYRALSQSDDPVDIALLNKKIAALKSSSTEKDLMLASLLLTIQEKKAEADSLTADIKKKFPVGSLMKNDAMTAVMRGNNAHKKDSLYQVFIHNFPEDASDQMPENAMIINMYDNLRTQIASAYLKEDNMEGYEKYAALIKNKDQLFYVKNNAAYGWAQNDKNLELAEKFSKETVQDEKSPAFEMFADTYAYILYKQGKYEEALKYQQKVYELSKQMNTEVNEHYALILAANKKYAKAQEVIAKSIKAGTASPAMEDELKKDYVKVNGNEKGYDQYMASLQKENNEKLKKQQQKQQQAFKIEEEKVKKDFAKTVVDFSKDMVNTPAPAFSLKDINGKPVSLNDLKGKTVVVDFWATWCGPCKMSFPGMQMAVNKYKNDPNVVFLFVDTWETGQNYLSEVKKFIADNKYTFHVLMDEKNAEGKQAKVVSAFEVSGIPTKFIIDKNGNIRFKYTGYSGSSAKVYSEVINMISLTQKASDAPPKS